MPTDKKKLLVQFAHRFFYIVWLLTPSILLSITFFRPVLCADVLAFPFLEARLNRPTIVVLRLAWALLFVVFLLGMWNIFPASYGFYLYSIGNNPNWVLGLSSGMLIVLAAFVLFQAKGPGNTCAARTLFLVCSGLFLMKVMFSFLLDESDRQAFPVVAAGPSAVKFIYQRPFKWRVTPTDIVDAGEATFARYATHSPALPNKVVLLVVESWDETEKNLLLMQERFSAHGINVVQFGFKNFRGATLQGELREICSAFVELSAHVLDENFKKRCAPQYFKDRNYDVVGMHGYAKGFYARYLIWKNLGITESYFKEDLKFLKQCDGSFPGVCDADLISHGVALMSQRDKAFLYILTLGSHEPVPQDMVVPDLRYIGQIHGESNAQVVARNAIIALVSQLKTRSDTGCVMAYVVGDHQPPSRALMSQLENATKVPYLILNFHCQTGAR